MRTLIFDTETNGMRPKGKPQLAEEPYLVQLAAVLFQDRRPVGHMSCFCVPEFRGERAPIPKEKFFIDSGITDEIVDAVGLPYKVALGMLNNLVRQSDRIIAHNILFDDPIVRAAYSRVAAPQEQWWETPKFCTMKTLEPVLKLPGKYGYKFPSLDESYRALVDRDGFDGAHDAMVDVEACAKVLWAIEDKGLELWRLKENRT